MQRVINKAKNHEEAEEWDRQQQSEMTHEQRQEIAIILKRRFWGASVPDVRRSRAFQKRTRLKSEE